LLLLPLVLVVALLTALTVVYVRLPLPKGPPAPQTTLLLDRGGRLIATLHAEVDRTDIRIEAMPRHLRHAVIAVEDAGFYSHHGVSPVAIIRAAFANLLAGGIEQGGSTITQQYVKNAYTGSERTIVRKVEEALLAIKLEREISKDEILERYLNSIYFGRGAYGIEAAARVYFGVPASELRLIESATLAGLIAAPAHYDPVEHPTRARGRRNHVLDRMAEHEMISRHRAVALARRPVATIGRAEPPSGRAPYFVDHVTDQLVASFGGRETFTGGLRVRTTLDLDFQLAAEAAVEAHLGESTDPAVALVAIDPATGEIRAMVGGRDFGAQKVNLATGKGGGGRQAGSAFKPFVLAAALEEGISLRSRFLAPARITVHDPDCGRWEPENYGGASYGPLDLVAATARSVNTVFAQLIARVGPESVTDVARRLGIRSELEPVCSIALGSEEVTPLEMTTAYAALAAGGVAHRPVAVRLVRGRDGSVFERATFEGEAVMAENDAAQVTLALRSVIAEGTGQAAGFGLAELAGKTGTTNDNADAWFCGYSPLMAACVWVGYPEGRVPMTDVRGIRVTGGSFPALIWRDFMAAVHEGLDVPPFPEPLFTGTVIEAVPRPSPSPSPSAAR
jgi:penicillin-binding protein 1A